MADIPPPPPGFTIDAPPPPPGFTLDQPMSAGKEIGQTALGAAKELGGQVAGAADVVNQGMTPRTMAERSGHYTPEQIAEAKKWGQGVAQAAAHPLDTARDAVSGWMDKALPSPKTPQQAQERGAALLRGAENVVPAGGLVRDAAGIAARPLERALAPAAEKIAVAGEAKASEAAARAAPKNDLIRRVKSLGLSLTPQQAGGATARTVASAAGRPELERRISYKNAEKVNAAVAKDVGIDPKTGLSEATISTARKEANRGYEAAGRLGRVDLAADNQFREALVTWYGADKGKQVKHAEAFEICEYGRRVTPEEIKQLFPFYE